VEISLDNIGKRFQREWIFRKVSLNLVQNDRVAILGANGSGKSTLLQILSGYLTPSEGKIIWKENDQMIGVQDVFKHVALATPYMTLYEDFTLRENIQFFSSFKSFRDGLSLLEVAEKMGLSVQIDKPLKFYSSGMKQRVKLGLAIMSNTNILLLDEPSSHLDANAILWYQNLVQDFSSNRIICVASNKEETETLFCNKHLEVADFKGLDVRV
jgi:ABC-type multidrug transport system ATPase subunit